MYIYIYMHGCVCVYIYNVCVCACVSWICSSHKKQLYYRSFLFILSFSEFSFIYQGFQRRYKISKEMSILKFILQKYLQVSQVALWWWNVICTPLSNVSTTRRGCHLRIAYTSIHVYYKILAKVYKGIPNAKNILASSQFALSSLI